MKRLWSRSLSNPWPNPILNPGAASPGERECPPGRAGAARVAHSLPRLQPNAGFWQRAICALGIVAGGLATGAVAQGAEGSRPALLLPQTTPLKRGAARMESPATVQPATLQPAAPPGATPPASTKKPLEITSDSLEVDDRRQAAVFLGNVQADDGMMHLAANKMTVFYFPQSDSGGAGSTMAKGVREIHAEGNVVLVQEDQRGVGQTAIYKPADRTLELISTDGKASVRKKEDAVIGERIRLHLSADSRIERAVAIAGSKGRVTARITPDSDGGGGEKKNTGDTKKNPSGSATRP